MRQLALVVLILTTGPWLGAQTPKPSPTTARLYVLDCGVLTMTAEGVARYHVTPAETGETRMPVPCYLVAHPKGTLIWDVGVIPDDTVEQAGAAGAHYDVNPTAAALVRRTLRSRRAPSASSCGARTTSVWSRVSTRRSNGAGGHRSSATSTTSSATARS